MKGARRIRPQTANTHSVVSGRLAPPDRQPASLNSSYGPVTSGGLPQSSTPERLSTAPPLDISAVSTIDPSSSVVCIQHTQGSRRAKLEKLKRGKKDHLLEVELAEARALIALSELHSAKKEDAKKQRETAKLQTEITQLTDSIKQKTALLEQLAILEQIQSRVDARQKLLDSVGNPPPKELQDKVKGIVHFENIAVGSHEEMVQSIETVRSSSQTLESEELKTVRQYNQIQKDHEKNAQEFKKIAEFPKKKEAIERDTMFYSYALKLP